MSYNVFIISSQFLEHDLLTSVGDTCCISGKFVSGDWLPDNFYTYVNIISYLSDCGLMPRYRM